VGDCLITSIYRIAAKTFSRKPSCLLGFSETGLSGRTITESPPLYVRSRSNDCNNYCIHPGFGIGSGYKSNPPMERAGRDYVMESSTSVTTRNPEPPPRTELLSIQPRPAAADSDAANIHERPSRGPWSSEVPPTEMLTEVLGEMAFYYGACWLHHHSAQRRGKAR
jgi:hypothetical protein